MSKNDPQLTGFEPIIGKDAVCLVLGSMPGQASLARQRYYAHPRNAFWPIVAAYLGFAADAGYRQRCLAIEQSAIGLWDVLRHCQRRGSLDSRIRGDSIVANDFDTLLADYRGLRYVLFNGGTAARLFARHVLPSAERARALQCMTLPSTSPAFAAMPVDEKRARWHAALASCLS